MVDGNVTDLSVSANQIATLSVDEESRKGLIALEWIETPTSFGLPGLLRFSIFDDDPVDFVRVFRQFSTQSEIGFLLIHWTSSWFSFGWSIARFAPIEVPGVLFFGVSIPITFGLCVWTTTLFPFESCPFPFVLLVLYSSISRSYLIPASIVSPLMFSIVPPMVSVVMVSMSMGILLMIPPR